MDSPRTGGTDVHPESSTGDDGAPWSILAMGAGQWTGEETMPRAPWAPDGLQSQGRITARTVFGGKGLVSDYVQEVDGAVSLESHTVFRWDEAASVFVMHFFSGPGAPTVLEGRQDGQGLVFEGAGAMGPMRQTVRYGVDEMEVTSEVPDPSGAGWMTVFEGKYRR